MYPRDNRILVLLYQYYNHGIYRATIYLVQGRFSLIFQSSAPIQSIPEVPIALAPITIKSSI